jgi:hypothetical protein
VFAGRVVSSEWWGIAYVRVFGVWKTVMAVVSCVGMVAPIDGVTAVRATAYVLVSDACVAAIDCVSDVCATETMCEGGVCVFVVEGVIVSRVTA